MFQHRSFPFLLRCARRADRAAGRYVAGRRRFGFPGYGRRPGVTTQLRDTVTVVTGGASGIGLALAGRFAADGARAVVLLDLNGDAAAAAARELPAPVTLGLGLDVSDEAAVAAVVDRIESEIGPIDVWCSNAGIARGAGLGDDTDWDSSVGVHILAHVYAARHVLPRLVARGRGHLLITASAAGVLTNMDSAPYTVTKHGSLALAEWLAINHGDSGVTFSCLCPQGVNTPMLGEDTRSQSATRAAGGVIEPDQVAADVVAAMADGRFLVLPHPEVQMFEQRRAGDRDRWLAGMRRVRARLTAR
jgi:NAD(P)-dependent dehydrogenase (short-subunit alcohol dehydrogenase family)